MCNSFSGQHITYYFEVNAVSSMVKPNAKRGCANFDTSSNRKKIVLMFKAACRFLPWEFYLRHRQPKHCYPRFE